MTIKILKKIIIITLILFLSVNITSSSKLNINEIVLTLFLNWIALLLVKYLTVGGPWMTPEGRSESKAIPLAGRIPLFSETNIPVTIIFAIGAAILLYFLFKKTSSRF